ncbi:hypothetical protein [Vibrio parahaemolyticus]|uniref:hypothetical protein n=1 Tax=Vibrio parahaemolyticus TaxID=670 RepID=UPI0004191D03|nr:hypothetical protein [Vibrio parahaemolyticus]HCG7068563.1 hypothetical protein [Vibrio parahaemolyticus]
MNYEKQTGSERVSLWNPNAVVGWSVLFSPIFGAWLHSKNWKELGEERNAKQSMNWVYGGVVVFILVIFIPEKIASTISLGYLLSWYFSSGQQQVKHVRENLDNRYNKKSWLKPITIAVVGLASFVLSVSMASTYFDPETQKDIALTDISGVWRTDQDGTLVALRLDENIKTITVAGTSVPVRIKSFDNNNKILTLTVNNNPDIVWSIRQVFYETNRFTLTLTLDNGIQEDLSFVRNL